MLMRSRDSYKRLFLTTSVVSVCMANLPAVQAQDEQDQLELDEIVVTGSRMPTDLKTVPGSVTMIGTLALEQQSAITSDLGRILSTAVPGLATSAGDAANFAQTLRGRRPAFAIDGVVQTVPMRGGGRDLRIIDSAALERIEVVRGSTAIYGQGGAGGIINYITKRPKADGFSGKTEVGFGSSLSNLTSDSMNYSLRQAVSFKSGKFDFVGNGSYESVGLFYDADGDRIAPDPFGQGGIADAKTYSFFGKAGFDLSEGHRIEASLTYYDKAQDTEYTAGTGLRAVQKATVIRIDSPENTASRGLGQQPKTTNVFATLSYMASDVFGSDVKLQGLYQEFDGSFGISGRFIRPDGNLGGQSEINGKKKGLRLDINTPLDAFGNDGSILWGLDYIIDETGQSVFYLDGGDRKFLGNWMPEVELKSFAAFAQAHIQPTESLTLRGGLRYISDTLDVPDYTVLQTTAGGGNAVSGGSKDYKKLVFNVGAVYDLSEEASLFASFSQGYSVGDIGRVLRGFPATVPSINSSGDSIEAQIINSYEGGLRGDVDGLKYSLAVFYNTSNLGTRFDAITLELKRAPERIWGLEATLDANIWEKTRAGGTLAIVNGNADEDGDGTYETPLDAFRIPPVKATAYLEYDFAEDWTLRLQGMYSGSSSKFSEKAVEDRGFAEGNIESYFVADLVVSGKALGGTWSIGVENIFNNLYFPVISQTTSPSLSQGWRYATAPGATASIRYTIEY